MITEPNQTEQIPRNDIERFSRLHKDYRGRILEYALLLTQSDFHAEEIVQEVFLKLWTIRQKLDDVQNFDAWIYIVARNKTLDHLRSISCERSVRKELIRRTPMFNRTTEETIGHWDYQRLVSIAVEKLPPQRKLVYQLVRVEGWRREEVAKALGLSPNTVKVQMNHALRLIRNFVQQSESINLSCV